MHYVRELPSIMHHLFIPQQYLIDLILLASCIIKKVQSLLWGVVRLCAPGMLNKTCGCVYLSLFISSQSSHASQNGSGERWSIESVRLNFLLWFAVCLAFPVSFILGYLLASLLYANKQTNQNKTKTLELESLSKILQYTAEEPYS